MHWEMRPHLRLMWPPLLPYPWYVFQPAEMHHMKSSELVKIKVSSFCLFQILSMDLFPENDIKLFFHECYG